MSNFFNLLKTFIKTTELTSAEKKAFQTFLYNYGYGGCASYYDTGRCACRNNHLCPNTRRNDIRRSNTGCGSNFTYYFYSFRSIRN